VLNRRTSKLGVDHLDTLASKNLLALVYRSQEKFAPAEALYQEVLALRTEKLGSDHPDTIHTRQQLAILYRSMKALDRAIPLLEETLKLREAKFDADHPATIATQADLAALYCDAGRFKDAIPLLEEAHQKGSHDGYLAWVGGRLLTAYLRDGKTTEATAQLTEQVRAVREEFPAGSIELATALEAIGQALLDGNAYADAEPLLRESASIVEKNAHEPWQKHLARLLLGVALVGQQKYDDAEPLLIEGHAGLREHEAHMPREAQVQVTQYFQWLVQLYEAAGRPGKAEQWRKKLKKRETMSKN
jgi:tetratricopeptide (TPR) repeat protein